MIGIIGALIGLLLPALAAARAQAKATQCESNVRQLVIALNIYCSEYRDKYPPNFGSPAPGCFWYDAARIGEILFPANPGRPVEGGVAVCPEDELGLRSYSMNIWASCKVDSFVKKTDGKQGLFWGSSCTQSSQLILIAENWGTSSAHTAKGYVVSNEPFGYAGLTPGVRFGGGTGVPKTVPIYGRVECELPYIRHRGWNGAGWGSAPHGRISIGYADGHVELKSDTELVDWSGKSTLDSLWSPLDPTINN